MADRKRHRTRPLATKVVNTEAKMDGAVIASKKQTSHGGESFDVHPSELGSITVGGGSTINMDDFNSVKVYVSLTLPTKSDDESIREAYDRASGLVDGFIQEEQLVASTVFDGE